MQVAVKAYKNALTEWAPVRLSTSFEHFFPGHWGSQGVSTLSSVLIARCFFLFFLLLFFFKHVFVKRALCASTEFLLCYDKSAVWLSELVFYAKSTSVVISGQLVWLSETQCRAVNECGKSFHTCIGIMNISNLNTWYSCRRDPKNSKQTSGPLAGIGEMS